MDPVITQRGLEIPLQKWENVPNGKPFQFSGSNF